MDNALPNAREILAGLQQQLEQAKARLSVLQKSFEREQKALLDQLAETSQKIEFLLGGSPSVVVEEPNTPDPAPVLHTANVPPPAEQVPPPGAAAPLEEQIPEAPLQRPETLEPTRLIPLDPGLLRTTFGNTPKLLGELRQNLHYFLRHPHETEILRKIGLRAVEIATAGAALECNPVSQIASGLDRLIADLLLLPDQMSKGALRTAGQALEFMSLLLEDQHLEKMQAIHSPILVSVDDEPQAQRLLMAAMESTAAQVVPCLSSHEALEMLDANDCSLIMLDLNMPGINGLDLCRKIRLLEKHQKTPVVFVTGAATVENRAQSSLNGGNDFIAKPFQLTELALKALLWICKGHFGLM